MRIGKLWLVVLLSALPAVASAQVNVGVSVNANVDIDADAYDTTAPGDPVESVDVFYDQLQPYGVWVDDPDAGRVFIPSEDNFVPYTNGHWEYTRLGFVWISSEPHAWATSHYGRWSYSSPYGRWVWSPDTEWGPAWVEWRQTSGDFGWAPLPPQRIAVNYAPPIESWHYCSANHVLDSNVTRYYEPRDRVVVIHREARPIEHYSTVSNVRVVVGPPPSVLRDHRVEAKPVRVEQRTIGRWAPAEAHAQVTHAQEHRATFEVENQKRLETNTRIHTAQVKVIETHPQIKVQADARLEAARTNKPMPAEANHGARVEPNHPVTPNRIEPAHGEPNRMGTQSQHVEPARPAPQPAHPAEHQPPQRVEPARPAPNRVEPAHPAPQPNRVEPSRPEPAHAVEHQQPQRPEPRPAAPHVEPARPEPRPAAPAHVEPARPEPRPAAPARVEPARPEPRPAAPARVEPARPAPQPHSEAPHPAPAPHAEPAKGGEHREPEKK